MNNKVIGNIIETARTYSRTCGAFVVVFKDGTTLSCRTPEECRKGIESLYAIKSDPDKYPEISTIKLPEEGGTHYWLREAP